MDQPPFSKEGYPGKFCRGAPTMREAFERCKAGGVVVAANGSWYRIMEGDEEKVKRADFEFLVISDGNKPVEFVTTFSSDHEKWEPEKPKDLTGELGPMEDEAAAACGVEGRLMDDGKALSAVEEKIALSAKRAPHIRLTMLSFSLSDEEFEVPAWRIEFKNWPTVSYLKGGERSRSVKAVVDALSGKILSYKEA